MATMTQPRTERPRDTANILERSMCLVLSRHYLGNHRKVRTEAVVEAAGGEAGRVDSAQVKSTKRLVDNAVLRPANRILGEVQDGLRRRAIAAHRVFGERTYLLPMLAAEEADQWLEGKARELRVEAALIAENYTAAVEEQRTKLGPLFDITQYPTLDEVRSAFWFEWHYVQFKAPEKLESVSSAAYQSALKREGRLVAAAFDEVRLVMRESLRDLVSELTEKLRPSEDGKRKQLRSTALEDVHEFMASFAVKNLTDDAELEAMAERVRRLLHGVDVEQLRDMDALRLNLQAELQKATAELDDLVVPFRRAIRLPGAGE